MEDEKSWVFLSHSHQDYEKVANLRNILEHEGYRPLMFFLKCLEDDTEIDNLIKREIDCRQRFILCDTENSRKSEWVQKEVEYIKSKDRMYEVIGLDNPDDMKLGVSMFMHRTTVYISCSSSDSGFGDMLKRSLSGDFRILDSEANCLSDNIRNSVSDGYFIAVMSRSYCDDPVCKREFETAIKSQQSNYSSIIVIYIEADALLSLPVRSESIISALDCSGMSMERISRMVPEFIYGNDIELQRTRERIRGNIDNILSDRSNVRGHELLEMPIEKLEDRVYDTPSPTPKLICGYRFFVGYNAPVSLAKASEYFADAIEEVSSVGRIFVDLGIGWITDYMAWLIHRRRDYGPDMEYLFAVTCETGKGLKKVYIDEAVKYYKLASGHGVGAASLRLKKLEERYGLKSQGNASSVTL